MGQFLSKAPLSASVDGLGIKVVATATAGTTIHACDAVDGDDNYDEVWIWAMNTDTSDRKLTLEYGGATAPDNLIEKTITLEGGLILVVPGLILQNSKEIAAFAAAGNVIMLYGFVNKIRRT